MNLAPLRVFAVTVSAFASLYGSPLAAQTLRRQGPDAAPAAAEPSAPRPPGARTWGADIEIDPIAYALAGFSLHAGVTYARFRLDLGAYGLDIPEFVHKDEGFDQSFTGYGIKLQYFPFAEGAGAFAGISGGVGYALTELDGTELAERHTELSFGIQVGYRILLPADFYVTPWISVGYRSARDVTLGGRTAEADRLTIFPTIHLGRRFL